MESIALPLLALIVIIAILITLWLLRRTRATRDKIKVLTSLVRKMADQDEQKHRIEPQGKVEELSEALEPLAVRLKALTVALGGEREKFTTVLSTVDISVFLVDNERRVVMLNKAAEKLFGITSGAAVGRPFINLVHDHEIDSIVQRCLETKEQQRGIVYVERGKQYLESVATPLSDSILVFVQDITNLRRLEKIRQDFIGNISHELRTPIASLKALVETLQNGAIADKDVAEDFLHRMQVETDKLAQMVSELSELSRIESGDFSIKLEPVDVAVVAVRVVERLRAQAERALLSLSLDIDTGLPHVMGDENRIEQVLVNLVHNAIKFTPRNGKVTISLGAANNSVLISVSDTGIGIPADDLPRIFERFYKVDRARSGGGTGLGLAIAKHIVQAHGSDIRVSSEEGKGSTFTFSLPIARS